MWRKQAHRDPRVVFSWDEKNPDYEVLQLRLELAPDIYLFWQMRVVVDIGTAFFGADWTAFWQAHITDIERVDLGSYDAHPDRVSFADSRENLETFFERFYDVDVLTACLQAQDLLAIHGDLEARVAAPHRLHLFQANRGGPRLPRAWHRKNAAALNELRLRFAAWLDSMPLATPRYLTPLRES